MYSNALQESANSILYNGLIEELVDVLQITDKQLVVSKYFHTFAKWAKNGNTWAWETMPGGYLVVEHFDRKWNNICVKRCKPDDVQFVFSVLSCYLPV